ncbi:transmembrane protein 272-like isoform X2 [Sycon ciliatum]|uniref:transmembrane protein 272-like isoform X2 n=1 Tax=Sycon ciliatum TaxID=27933 RepID=UPI0020AAC888|eukprot:scpid41851/ scgid34909/ 
MGESSSPSAPPGYDATANPDLERGGAPPPSYDNLFGRIKNTKSKSSGLPDFLKKFAYVLCSSIACTIVSCIMLGLPIAMIVIGAIYKNDCEAQRFIPIYLIVAGSFGVVRALCCAKKGLSKDDDEDSGADGNAKDCGGIIDIFLFAWLICGSVWVYKIYSQVQHDNSDALYYCQATVYKFAFGVITASWSLFGLVLCCGCCLCIYGISSSD